MGTITIASFNVEKNGQSSTDLKNTIVNDFIAFCIDKKTGIIFLCEIHSSRLDDYVLHLISVYQGSYNVEGFPGGHSNGYVLIVRRDLQVKCSSSPLLGLNRDCVVCSIPGEISIAFAHFKSGQTGLTSWQLTHTAQQLEGAASTKGKWAIAGDMNWDIRNAGKLVGMPHGWHFASCWPDKTQRSGNILDWCAAGSTVGLVAEDGYAFFPKEYQGMNGPDHRPVYFTLYW